MNVELGMDAYRTCLISGRSVLSMERVLICETSTSGRPAAAMAGAGATARVRAHAPDAPPLAAAGSSRGAPRFPRVSPRSRKHGIACVFYFYVHLSL